MRLPFFVLIVLASVGPSAKAIDFLNQTEGLEYMGSETCVDCHAPQFATHAQSLHSRSAAPVDPEQEPDEGTFEHPSLPVRYSAIKRDGKLIHREEVLNDEGEVALVTEHAVDVAFGSGLHAKTYLFRDGDFYAQSPVSYFRQEGDWMLSPGYDRDELLSFRRDTTVNCVFCHVGSIKQVDKNPHRFSILEHQIGCERCHGPGQLHVQRRLDEVDFETGAADPTIVHPGRLTRELSEAVCAQCHCQGEQSVIVSGKSLWDFRPGQKLTDVRVDFRRQSTEGTMGLVGHMEQMHQSRCYTQSETMTCVTCHHPHRPTPSDKEERVAFYRNACYECHTDETCGEPRHARQLVNQNDCAACHMPKRDTTVTHVALHNHRIAVHGDSGDESSERSTKVDGSAVAALAPILNIDQHDAAQRDRLQALARYHAVRFPGRIPVSQPFVQDTVSKLLKIRTDGSEDSDVTAALAWMAFRERQVPIAFQMSQQVLARSNDKSDATVVATEVLGESLFQMGRSKDALRFLSRLPTYQRESRNHYLLGLVHQNLGDSKAAISSLERSLSIQPMSSGAHHALQAIHQSLGQLDEAASHASQAQFIDQWLRRQASQDPQ